MKRIALQHRLRLLAEMTPPGGRLADIGTDHGYLPVWLLQEGRIPSAIAADVGAEPLEHARRTAEEYETQGLDFRLCDGLSGIEPEETDTVVIAGMGGETIRDILRAAPWAADAPHPAATAHDQGGAAAGLAAGKRIQLHRGASGAGQGKTVCDPVRHRWFLR